MVAKHDERAQSHHECLLSALNHFVFIVWSHVHFAMLPAGRPVATLAMPVTTRMLQLRGTRNVATDAWRDLFEGHGLVQLRQQQTVGN
jgi:hypothetical protein